MENHYTVLDCQRTSTSEEIKRNYQKLIKTSHPDKGGESSELFIKIQEAWTMLKNQNTRKEYDDTLLQQDLNSHPLTYDEIQLKDLKFVDNLTHYTCRCGNDIPINKCEMDADENLLECSECSNYISVIK